MENVWNQLKTSKGRPWFDVKCLIRKTEKEPPRAKEIIQEYHVSSETLPELDRNIYGLHLKNEPFFLERCKICSQLLKSSVIAYHSGICNKKNGTGQPKKATFISPNKKKSTKRSNKSTSEDDSESVISSENSSPALDLLENQTNDPSVASVRDDSMIDIISVEEIPSEDSKPPTPGPQDLYEEFAAPFSEETSSFSSSVGSSDSSKFKPTLKLKIVSTKDAGHKSHGTSLLEAHLLSNTKYNTSSGMSSVDVQVKNSNYKLHHQTSLLEQAILKSEDAVDQPAETLKSISSAKLKTDTKISIPISALPLNVKIAGATKKQNVVSKSVLSKTNLQKLVDSKEKTDNVQSSRLFGDVVETDSALESSSTEYNSKEKTSARSRKNRHSKGKSRSSKTAEFDPDRHCGVLSDENKHCMRSLTCKTHSMALRRAVEGRSKDFDRLLAEHRASKEALKDQDRQQNINLIEPVISIPLLAVDKIAGNTIQVPTGNNDTEVVRVRASNLSSSAENQKLQIDSESQKGSENDGKFIEKLLTNAKSSSSKSTNSSIYRFSSNGNSQAETSASNEGIKLQYYDNDLKISFVCSDMLYKVGGLLYTDRSRQAIRKCMMPLTSNGAVQKATLSKQSHPSHKITDFLQLVKNTLNPPAKLNLLKAQNVDDSSAGCKNENGFKSPEEIERMRNLLTTTSKVLSTLSSDENELRKLRLTRLKRSADKGRLGNGKRVKQESITDENYDINTLLSFDKSLLNKTTNDVQFPIVPSDGYTCSFRNVPSDVGKELPKFVQQQCSDNASISYNVTVADNGIGVGLANHANENVIGYQENDASQLWQTFRDLENEIRNTVGVSNIQELYTTSSLSGDTNETYQGGFANAELLANSSTYQENGENDIEETISKNYSLLEEYCKNITTDELLLDGKGNYEFYESGIPQVRDSEMKLEKDNGTNIINEHMYTHVGNATVNDGSSVGVSADGLNFDAHVLTSYLSSVTGGGGTSTQNINVNDINFVTGDQFSVVHMDTAPIQGQTLTKEHVYEEILTLNKQFQDSAAVKIEKPPTPNPVYKETENEEVLMKWLF